jgi:methylenetetrahydrofolate reductase (NADPH)
LNQEKNKEMTKDTSTTAFSFELLPPLRGKKIQQVFGTIDMLKEFNPRYINITTHHSENVYKEDDKGNISKQNIRKRPGTVAIAAAIQNRYGIRAVPHIICTGFTKEETEYALIDLDFLGVRDLLLLRGDANKLDVAQRNFNSHAHATDLQLQVNEYNSGILQDGTKIDAPEIPFTYGMACYPEIHEEAPNMDAEIRYAKLKVDQGASYLVTQMFFDNQKYFDFVDNCRAEGITVPIIPGIKPIHLINQLTILPKIFRSSIPTDLEKAIRACKTDEDAKTIGVEWAVQQCRELKAANVEGIHFYAFMAADSIYRIAKEVY